VTHVPVNNSYDPGTMSDTVLNFENEDVERLEALLADRIYEFNAQAIDRFDAQSLGAAIRDKSGEVIAAISGYTWAGCCQITHLWVSAGQRGQGLGRKLLVGAEAEAIRRGCQVIQLSTHSFQAPGFYERVGYTRQAIVPDHPVGHSSIFYARALKSSVG
jgi:ribosomal protein S18 acetylase RimI-like enzyme